MKTIRKIWNRIFGNIKAYYEGARWRWGERSWVFGTNQDARLDAGMMERKELMRKARYFEKNNAFVNRLADIFEQYTVGAGGLPVVSDSKDATDYFANWCKDCDALGLMDFGGIQGVAARSWFIDGDCFVVRVMVKGRLKIQIIEAHRVETPPDMANKEGISVIDGMGIDSNGCFTGIWVNIGSETPYITSAAEAWRFIGRDDVIPVFEPSRTAMYRGITFLSSVMNDINDLDDLQLLTMQVAKQAATIGNVTTNATGELDTLSSRRQRVSIQTMNQAGAPTTKNTADYYQVRFGANEIALKYGDSIKQFQAERPSLAEREHWEYLLTKICAGIGISKLLASPYSMQGTVVRADLDISSAYLSARSIIIQNMVKRVYAWVIDWAQQFDREVLRGGFNFSNWEKVTVRHPRSVNVDVGRNSRALVSELQAGLRTYKDIYAESGQDGNQMLEEKAKEAAFISQLAKTYGVDPNDIAERVSAGVSASKGEAIETQTDEQ